MGKQGHVGSRKPGYGGPYPLAFTLSTRGSHESVLSRPQIF